MSTCIYNGGDSNLTNVLDYWDSGKEIELFGCFFNVDYSYSVTPRLIIRTSMSRWYVV